MSRKKRKFRVSKATDVKVTRKQRDVYIASTPFTKHQKETLIPIQNRITKTLLITRNANKSESAPVRKKARKLLTILEVKRRQVQQERLLRCQKGKRARRRNYFRTGKGTTKPQRRRVHKC